MLVEEHVSWLFHSPRSVAVSLISKIGLVYEQQSKQDYFCHKNMEHFSEA